MFISTPWDLCVLIALSFVVVIAWCFIKDHQAKQKTYLEEIERYNRETERLTKMAQKTPQLERAFTGLK